MKKIYLSIIKVLIILITYNCEAYHIPHDYTNIDCVVKPFIRRSKKNRRARYYNISHPNIPCKKNNSMRPQKNYQKSMNWSGYVASNNLTNSVNNSVLAVYGSWIVPNIIPSNNNRYSAVWLGIDGYSNDTVEQIGTGHDYVNGSKNYYAWFEMYPQPSYMLIGFPVNTGDTISAMVKYSGNNTFTLQIMNDTQKVATTVPAQYTRSINALRSSAEWILEAPSKNQILPLTHISKVYFSACKAKIGRKIQSLKNPFWPRVQLRMVMKNDSLKTIPSRIAKNKKSFFIRSKYS